MAKPMPMIFVSHGSTMMAGEQCVVSEDWQETGRQAELRGVKGIVIMVCLPSLISLLSITISREPIGRKVVKILFTY